MPILTELKKLTKKKNATVISQALPDSLDGSGSGSGGGGANVLTLYAGTKGSPPDATFWAYKDAEHTLEYETLEEARSALESASSIKVYSGTNYAFPVNVMISESFAYVEIVGGGGGLGENLTSIEVFLYRAGPAIGE